jgi:hypothetical protein
VLFAIVFGITHSFRILTHGLFGDADPRHSTLGGVWLGMRLVLRGTHSPTNRVLLAHVASTLCVAVVSCALEVINVRASVGPHNRVCWATKFGATFGRILI